MNRALNSVPRRTASKYALEGNTLALEVDYTTAKPVEGLSGLGEWIWNIKVPVGAVWKLLPWNRGRAPQCSIEVVYWTTTSAW